MEEGNIVFGVNFIDWDGNLYKYRIMQSDAVIYPPIKSRGPGRPATQRKSGIDEGPAKKGATPRGRRPRTRPRKVDYGVLVENNAEDPLLSEFIAQFEPVVPQRAIAKGKGKKTYKGKGKKRASAPPIQPGMDPAFYDYGPYMNPNPNPNPAFQCSAQVRTL
ncbi:hypothetical protein FRX31_027224 [Thalictrum thalictroides]|uniref:Uncharacterized protein n=1 Tax=Thalictrum thalictroides TaxID=46969 RepID=A0A7J6VDL3_THATH|nr:hypothetical protein FRX31_027224 [Thalictrum thalictroides]